MSTIVRLAGLGRQGDGVPVQPLQAAFVCSLDLRVADASGRFDWVAPTDEVHAFANELESTVGTHLSGRRMWDTMRFRLTHPEDATVSGEYAALWRRAAQVVLSPSLDAVDAPRTRLERRFDRPTVRSLKESASAPLSVGGAGPAGRALAAGLVDRLDPLLVPVVVGEGPRALPDAVAADPTLRSERTFAGGWVHLAYDVGGAV